MRLHYFILVFCQLFLVSCFDFSFRTKHENSGSQLQKSQQGFMQLATEQDCLPDQLVNQGGCQNQSLPPTPPIMRDLMRAGRGEGHLATSGADEYTDEFLKGEQQYKILPYWRPSIDGRLYLSPSNNWVNFPVQQTIKGNKGLVLLYLDPELYDYDFRVSQNRNPLVTGAVIHPIVFTTMHPAQSQMTVANMGTPHHVEMCNDSGYVGSPIPKKCSAYTDKNKSETVYGDCYDVTLITQVDIKGIGNELRSTPVTIFVKNAKTHGRYEQIFIYPRESEYPLPSLELVADLANLGEDLEQLASACLTGQGQFPTQQQGRPYYCQFIYDQERLNQVRIGNSNQSYPNTSSFFEPSVTGDGMLMIVNFGLGQGLFYSYNEKSACSIQGWKNFRPISEMPFDPNLYSIYPIAMNQRQGNKSVPYRDNLGNPISPGQSIEGAYHWIDRHGRNLFYATINTAQDYIKDESGQRMDNAPGKGYQVLGAWSNGKMVTLDGVINMFDFGSRPHRNSPTHNAKLYHDNVMTMKPVGSTMIGSFENKFNWYDALSPNLPFDTVWSMSSDIEKNAEIIFDDYMLNNAIVVAHMNAAIDSFSRGVNRFGLPETLSYYKNGYFPKNLNQVHADPNAGGDFRLLEVPVLQNAATYDSTPLGTINPKGLFLKGGARVEPVALGGVYGKGVYLDGVNDYIEMTIEAETVNDYIFSVWLAPDNFEQRMTLFTFADGATVELEDKSIKFYAGSKMDKISLKGLQYLNDNEFFHLALQIEGQGNNRAISVFVNGTLVRNNKIINGRSHSKHQVRIPVGSEDNQSYFTFLQNRRREFTVSAPPRSWYRGWREGAPFKGWVDELRIYEFPSGAIPPYFEEYICNQAFGSIVRVLSRDSTVSSIAHLYDRAREHGLFGISDRMQIPIPEDLMKIQSILSGTGYVPFSPQRQVHVCEQLRIESYDSPNDFSDQRGKTLCAANIYKNINNSRCLRTQLLEKNHIVARAGSPRPNFSNNDFCLSCHTVPTSQLPSLSKTALISIPGLFRENDHRRPPMDSPPILFGQVPTLPSNEFVAPFLEQHGQSGEFSLDTVFDFYPKVTPYR